MLFGFGKSKMFKSGLCDCGMTSTSSSIFSFPLLLLRTFFAELRWIFSFSIFPFIKIKKARVQARDRNCIWFNECGGSKKVREKKVSKGR